MFTEETVKTSNKLLLTTISLELESIELSKVKVLSVLRQHGPLSTGEPFLVMEELSMALKKEEMEDHLRSLLVQDNPSTASMLPSQNSMKVIMLLFTAQLTTLMVELEPSPQLTISKSHFGLTSNLRLKCLSAMSLHTELIKLPSILPHTLLLFNHIDVSP